ncbi:hypothetical protein [Streptomyces sp. NPDC051665]|uniref:hypothetical protein n=1 Tax=Streptomyces sp. NPDC051665 TaxID=3154647 RepID=UPI003436FCE8
MSAAETPRPGIRGAQVSGSNAHVQGTSGEWDFVSSAAVIEDPFYWVDHGYADPCAQIVVTLCGSLRARLEEAAAQRGISAADYAAALIVEGLDGGDRR